MDLFTPYSDVLKAGKGNPYHDERGRFASGPTSKLASEFKRWKALTSSSTSYDDRIAAGEKLIATMKEAKLSRAEWHKLGANAGDGDAGERLRC